MECFKLSLRPQRGAFHTAGGFLVSYQAVTPRRLTHINALRDDTIVAVCLLEGDADSLDRGLAERPEVLEYEIFGRTGTEFYAYMRVQPESPATELLAIADEYNLVLDTPFEVEPDGSLTVSVAGPRSAIRRVMNAFPTELMSGDIRHVGTFEPGTRKLDDELTDIQRAVVRAALDRGYYAIPRAVTQAELAEEFDCSAATIGEHLRKAENLILSRTLG